MKKPVPGAAGVVLAGGILGLIPALLEHFGNPPNMGICVVCFERDIAGALGLHAAAKLSVLRPEVMGFVIGAMLASLSFGEFRARSGSAPLLRFVLGVFASIGALVFMGCTWRLLCRLTGLDLTALTGLAGLVAGVAIAGWIQHRGFFPGTSTAAPKPVGLIFPALAVGALLLAIFEPSFREGGPIITATAGPGAMTAPLLLALAGGLLVGGLAQRTKFCTVGAIRTALFGGQRRMILAVAAFVAVGLAAKLAFGSTDAGYRGQPLAHSDLLWNILGMVLAGLAFTLAGGCPGRQLVLAGEGDADAGVFILGAVAGAALSHTLNLAALPDRMVDGALVVGGPPLPGRWAVILGITTCIALGLALRRRAPTP
jgi:uncharacterized protein